MNYQFKENSLNINCSWTWCLNDDVLHTLCLHTHKIAGRTKQDCDRKLMNLSYATFDTIFYNNLTTQNIKYILHIMCTHVL